MPMTMQLRVSCKHYHYIAEYHIKSVEQNGLTNKKNKKKCKNKKLTKNKTKNK